MLFRSPNGTHICEVEIDPDTGVTRIVRYSAVNDFGVVVNPMIVAGQVTGLEAFKIGQMAGRQLPLLAVFVPFWIVFIMDGVRGVRETWPAVLVAGSTFAFGVYFTSNFIGPELPDITSALISLVSLTLFLKVWKPKRIFRFSDREAGVPVRLAIWNATGIRIARAPTFLMKVDSTITARTRTKTCDRVVRIPFAADFGSLNVSNAAAVALYAASRA